MIVLEDSSAHLALRLTTVVEVEGCVVLHPADDCGDIPIGVHTSFERISIARLEVLGFHIRLGPDLNLAVPGLGRCAVRVPDL